MNKLSHVETFDRDGIKVSSDDVEARNHETERKEIEWLQTGPANVFLYVSNTPTMRPTESRSWARGNNVPSCCRVALKSPGALKCPICGTSCEIRRAQADIQITTWPGTPVATHVYVGPSKPIGGIAGRFATKRAVSCKLFGVAYYGWYYESAGNYCRLYRSKRQS